MATGLVEVIRLRADPDLRDALAAAARARRLSMSEMIRRHLRETLGAKPTEARNG